MSHLENHYSQCFKYQKKRFEVMLNVVQIMWPNTIILYTIHGSRPEFMHTIYVYPLAAQYHVTTVFLGKRPVCTLLYNVIQI